MYTVCNHLVFFNILPILNQIDRLQAGQLQIVRLQTVQLQTVRLQTLCLDQRSADNKKPWYGSFLHIWVWGLTLTVHITKAQEGCSEYCPIELSKINCMLTCKGWKVLSGDVSALSFPNGWFGTMLYLNPRVLSYIISYQSCPTSLLELPGSKLPGSKPSVQTSVLLTISVHVWFIST